MMELESYMWYCTSGEQQKVKIDQSNPKQPSIAAVWLLTTTEWHDTYSTQWMILIKVTAAEYWSLAG